MTGSRLKFATRLNSFVAGNRAGASVANAVRAIAGVGGITSVELNFPQHFMNAEPQPILQQIEDLGLTTTALNLRFDDSMFANGAFTSSRNEIRQASIRLCSEAVELATHNRIGHVILWMGPDGFDYPFQANFGQSWEWEIDGFRRVAEQNDELRVSVEYKPSDPRRVSLIRSMSDSLLAARDVGRPNFGVTMDFCHALMAGEHPAAAAALAIREGRLFGVHLNDGYGPADDGLMVGSIHPWHTLELLLELRRGAYDGTIYFDTFPNRLDPAAECAANLETVMRFERMLDNLDDVRLRDSQAAQDAIEVTKLIQNLSSDTASD